MLDQVEGIEGCLKCSMPSAPIIEPGQAVRLQQALWGLSKAGAERDRQPKSAYATSYDRLACHERGRFLARMGRGVCLMTSRTLGAAIVVACATMLGGCVSTSMQGYADLERPARLVEHIAVVAPPALIPALAVESPKYGLVVDDGNVIVPPTRAYKDAEIRQLLGARGVDGVLVVSVTGDTGVQHQYAGTIFSANYSGDSSSHAMIVGKTISASGTSSGAMRGMSTSLYRYDRTVAFQARLSDPKSGRNLWVGGGQTRAGGALFMGDATSVRDAASAVLNDLQEKGLVGASGA
jgi:hypothetical protein